MREGYTGKQPGYKRRRAGRKFCLLSLSCYNVSPINVFLHMCTFETVVCAVSGTTAPKDPPPSSSMRVAGMTSTVPLDPPQVLPFLRDIIPSGVEKQQGTMR